MTFEFDTTPKKKSEKRKLMLWIETDLLDQIDEVRPVGLTIQECIRQILRDYLKVYDPRP